MCCYGERSEEENDKRRKEESFKYFFFFFFTMIETATEVWAKENEKGSHARDATPTNEQMTNVEGYNK